MKSLYPGNFPLTDQEFDQLFNSCHFTFDTNVLFNVYKIAPQAQEQFFQILEILKDRIWLPRNVADEFMTGKNNIIKECIETHENKIKIVTELIKQFDTNSFYFIQNTSINIKSELNKLIDDIKTTIENYEKLITNDTILNRIANYFDGKIGREFTENEIQDIEKKGADRFNRNIPPGYKDNSKRKNKFGDLIIWNQLIDFSKVKKIPIVFVSNDQKEDWYDDINGKKIGPCAALRNEFHKKTEQIYYSYSPENFYKIIGKSYGIDLTSLVAQTHIFDKKSEYNIYYGGDVGNTITDLFGEPKFDATSDGLKDCIESLYIIQDPNHKLIQNGITLEYYSKVVLMNYYLMNSNCPGTRFQFHYLALRLALEIEVINIGEDEYFRKLF